MTNVQNAHGAQNRFELTFIERFDSIFMINDRFTAPN